jgi:uncharacterized protein (DUF302 family)
MSSITQTEYGLQATFDRSPEEVDAAIRAALAAEGFGILSEIDVQATLKAKLEVDPGTYTILGACNPNLANRAIAAEGDVGLLLPCNVLIRTDDSGQTVLSVIDPDAMMSVADAPGLVDVAKEARTGLERAMAATAEALGG